MFYVVTIRGMENPVKCESLSQCPLKPENLILMNVASALDAPPHGAMRGSWSLPASVIASYIVGESVQMEAPKVEYVPHGPTIAPEDAPPPLTLVPPAKASTKRRKPTPQE